MAQETNKKHKGKTPAQISGETKSEIKSIRMTDETYDKKSITQSLSFSFFSSIAIPIAKQSRRLLRPANHLCQRLN